MFWLVATPAVLGKELLTYFIRVDGAPSFSFFLALSCGVLNIVLDYVFAFLCASASVFTASAAVFWIDRCLDGSPGSRSADIFCHDRAVAWQAYMFSVWGRKIIKFMQ